MSEKIVDDFIKDLQSSGLGKSAYLQKKLRIQITTCLEIDKRRC